MKPHKSLDGKQAPAEAEPASPERPEADLPVDDNTAESLLEQHYSKLETPAPADEAEETTEVTDEEETEEVTEAETEEQDDEQDDTEEESEEDAEEATQSEDAYESPEGELTEIEDLSPEQKKAVQARINQLTASKKAGEEKIQSLEQENADLKTKLEQASPMSADEAMAVARAGLHPSYLTQDEAKLVAEAQALKAEAAWAWDNQDGAFDGDKEYTAKEMRAYYRKVQDKLEQIQPRVSALIQEKSKLQQEDIALARDIRSKRDKLKPAAKATGKTEKPAKPAPPSPPPSAGKKPPASVSRPSQPVFDPDAMLKRSEGVTSEDIQSAMEATFSR